MRNTDNLEHVDIESSFVLDWQLKGGDLVFTIEACLTGQHPDYTLAKPGEAMCWMNGELVFESPIEIRGLKDRGDVTPTVGSDGSEDYGEIEALGVNSTGEWGICGEFGDVFVVGSSPTLRLYTETKNAEQDAALKRQE